MLVTELAAICDPHVREIYSTSCLKNGSIQTISGDIDVSYAIKNDPGA